MHIPESAPQRSAGRGPHSLTLYSYSAGVRPLGLSRTPNDTGVVKAGSDILHKVGEKLLEVFLDPVVTFMDPLVIMGAEVVV